MPGPKTFSATLGTVFMEKNRNELLISKSNEILFFFLRACKELIMSIYVPRETGKNNGGIFHACKMIKEVVKVRDKNQRLGAIYVCVCHLYTTY